MENRVTDLLKKLKDNHKISDQTLSISHGFYPNLSSHGKVKNPHGKAQNPPGKMTSFFLNTL